MREGDFIQVISGEHEGKKGRIRYHLLRTDKGEIWLVELGDVEFMARINEALLEVIESE